MSHGTRNAILAQLSRPVQARLAPFLTSIAFEQGETIARSGQHVRKIVFPHNGILSCVVETIDGTGIEIRMIGRDGVFGAVQALHHMRSIYRVVVQVPCSASAIDSKHVKALVDSLPELGNLLVRYDYFGLAQVQQTAACNALHSVEQRVCRWLLRMHDLVGSELPITQEFLAQMMGVRRTSVTMAALSFQKDGLISYSRGKVRIVDLEGIKRRACECADTIRETYNDLFGDHDQRIKATTDVSLDPPPKG
jgi:CRP-like cAMP-binding protein